MMQQRVLLAVSAGLLIAIIVGFIGLKRTPLFAANEPVSSIGRSGDFKSPGGTTEASERSHTY